MPPLLQTLTVSFWRTNEHKRYFTDKQQSCRVYTSGFVFFSRMFMYRCAHLRCPSRNEHRSLPTLDGQETRCPPLQSRRLPTSHPPQFDKRLTCFCAHLHFLWFAHLHTLESPIFPLLMLPPSYCSVSRFPSVHVALGSKPRSAHYPQQQARRRSLSLTVCKHDSPRGEEEAFRGAPRVREEHHGGQGRPQHHVSVGELDTCVTWSSVVTIYRAIVAYSSSTTVLVRVTKNATTLACMKR